MTGVGIGKIGISLGHDFAQELGVVYLRMDVPFITSDRAGNLLSADYEGYAIAGRALANKMALHIKKKTG
jgi:hypothetical protein